MSTSLVTNIKLAILTPTQIVNYICIHLRYIHVIRASKRSCQFQELYFVPESPQKAEVMQHTDL